MWHITQCCLIICKSKQNLDAYFFVLNWYSTLICVIVKTDVLTDNIVVELTTNERADESANSLAPV